jgi:hypothetical protein
MACAYCGKEVPFRMRLTGEAHFCCLTHKRLYHDEHSRIGLARLMEEVSTGPEDEAGTPAEVLAPAESKVDKQPLVDALPEPELVYSGQGLRLWTYPHQPYSFKPRFDHFGVTELAPAEYTAGRISPPEPKKPEEVPDASTDGEVGEAVGPVQDPAPPGGKASSSELTSAPATTQERVEDEPVSSDKRLAISADPVTEGMIEQPGFQTVERTASGGGYRMAAGVVLALCLGAGGYLGLGIGGGGNTTTATKRTDGSVLDEWIPDWSETETDGGIALFGPSQEWSDYRVQWNAESDKNLAWVFRAADPSNYYAVQIQRADDGGLLLVRYAVVDGTRLDVVESSLSLPATGREILAVELEVVGSRFVLCLEGRNVAEWSDDRLPSGGFGVVRPDAGLAEVDDVKVIRLNGQSATNRRFWKGLPPDTMPEVTALPPARESSQESEEL